MKLIFSAGAREDVREGYDYYLRISLALAREFLEAVERGVQVVRDHPDRWVRVSPDLQKYRLKRFPYSVIYQSRPKTVRIVAVAHARRRPGYWNRRP